MDKKQIKLPAMTKIDSGSIHSLGHVGTTLYVKFHSGAVYEYTGVPADVYAEMHKAKSIGGFFQKQIRDQYRHKRLDQD